MNELSLTFKRGSDFSEKLTGKDVNDHQLRFDDFDNIAIHISTTYIDTAFFVKFLEPDSIDPRQLNLSITENELFKRNDPQWGNNFERINIPKNFYFFINGVRKSTGVQEILFSGFIHYELHGKTSIRYV